jgi:hypothetical protein
MARLRDDSKKERPVTLKIDTYLRLERYKAKLIGERETANVSFADAIDSLLDMAEAGSQKKKGDKP